MARAFMGYDPERDGTLEVEECGPNCVKVYFVPPRTSMGEAGLDPNEAAARRVQLLLLNGQDRFLTIHPIYTFGQRDDFLKQKYDQVERITLEDINVNFPDSDERLPATPDDVLQILEDLPSTFVKDYSFGLGLTKPYRFIIEAVEELSDCTEIVISKSSPTGIATEGEIFNISVADFERVRKALNRITNNGQTAVQSVKDVIAYNTLAEKLGLTEKPVKVGRHPLRKLITAAARGEESPLAEDEQAAVLSVIAAHTKSLAEAKPESLAKLQSDIELVTLETLIQRYEEMIGKNLKENSWQSFFNKNPFILNMAFGYPVIKVQDQASVGGRKLSGSGEKITDFLVKNSLTNNTAIFEIKTPKAALLNKTPFRDGVYTPSAELSGSINQALDQKYQFQGQIAQIKNTSRIFDIESYSIHCCLIVGTMPSGDDQLKSFELFRRNSKDVEIVTFDELLEKLKQLSAFLRTADDEALP